MLRSIKVSDYMTKQLIVFSKETDLFEAIQKLLDNNISGAPVVDENNHVVGLLSELDCLKSILGGSYYDEVGGKVGDYMTEELTTISPNEDMIAVAEMFIGKNRRRLPVVDGQRKLVGQISRRDVLRCMRDYASHIGFDV